MNWIIHKILKNEVINIKTTKHINYARRGMNFEEDINITNEMYRHTRKALIVKFPTPWKVIFRRGTNIPVKAWCEDKSFLDYVGIYKGKAITFDAKSTKEDKRFPLSNIKPHQYQIMKEWTEHGGISFLLIRFDTKREEYLLPYEVLKTYWEESLQGGRKSIPYEDFKKCCPLIKATYLSLVDYLTALDL